MEFIFIVDKKLFIRNRGSKSRKIKKFLRNRSGWIWGKNKKLRLKLVLIKCNKKLKPGIGKKLKKQEAGFPRKLRNFEAVFDLKIKKLEAGFISCFL